MRDTDGGPAFPGQRVETLVFKDVNTGNVEARDIKHAVQYPGMTLRDYFAGQALAAVVAFYGRDTLTTWREDALGIGEDVYAIADALLAARKDGAQ